MLALPLKSVASVIVSSLRIPISLAGYCKKQPGWASHTEAVSSSHGLGMPTHSKSQLHPRVLLQ
jgi:hypothetical protein